MALTITQTSVAVTAGCDIDFVNNRLIIRLSYQDVDDGTVTGSDDLKIDLAGVLGPIDGKERPISSDIKLDEMFSMAQRLTDSVRAWVDGIKPAGAATKVAEAEPAVLITP